MCVYICVCVSETKSVCVCVRGGVCVWAHMFLSMYTLGKADSSSVDEHSTYTMQQLCL